MTKNGVVVTFVIVPLLLAVALKAAQKVRSNYIGHHIWTQPVANP